MDRKRRLGTLLLLMALVAGPGTLAAATKVGSVAFARGVVTAHVKPQPPRLLGRRAPVYQGDIISTGPKSFAVIRFEDGGRMSLRPDTVFTVKRFEQKKSTGSLFMSLFKGGLRMISGLISKRNPNGVKLSASGVTIGIRGTKFDARICRNDCRGESIVEAADRKIARPRVVGRVALMRGAVDATDRNQRKRRITRGAPLYEGDTLETGRNAYAVLVMRDRGRFTLKPGTVFRIDKHRYRPATRQQKKTSSSLFGAAFSLLKGGVRVLTGLIARANHKAFSIRTAQATIGIRGTGFDLLDLGPCTSSAPCGLVASVWFGKGITGKNNKGLWDIKLHQSAAIRGRDAVLVYIKNPPVFNVPRPDREPIDFEKLFGILAGVYVTCEEGHCSATRGGQTVDAVGGESVVALSEEPGLILVRQVQPFQFNDPYLQTIDRHGRGLGEAGNPVGPGTRAFCEIQGG